MTSGKPEKLDFEERVELFRVTLGFEGVGRKELEEIAGLAFARRFNRGEFIFYEGEPANHFHVVANGRVKVTKTSAEGRSFTAIVADRGDTLNAVVLFDNSPRFLSAQAMEDVLVMFVKAEDFIPFVFRHSVVAKNIITILGRIVESSYDRTIDMVGERVEQRLLNVLYMLFHKFGMILKFTNNELADLAGTTTETTIRVMIRLRELGIIDTRRWEIRILDHRRLEGLSRGPFLI